MDFDDTPQEAAFRAEARAWLDANAELLDESGVSRIEEVALEERIARGKEWQAKKAAAGWAAIHWPKEYGGRGASRLEAVIYEQEEARYDVPRGIFSIGINICASALLGHASEEQKRRYLPKLASGEEIWCQLFSEPVAGSDLAGLRTRAERDGDEWRISGQKVWNSGAHYADYGILVARHDPDLAKHKGLTFFIVDMKADGVEARPIRQIPGRSEFNEVFFNDVRIPDRNRIGEVGEGWQVAITTLMNERSSAYRSYHPDEMDLLALAKRVEIDGRPAIENATVRQRIASWYVQTQGVQLTNARALTALAHGRQPGPEGSISKVVVASNRQEIASFGADLQELAGTLTDWQAGPARGLFQDGFLQSPGLRIAAGTDEILRNIIAERVLGLPSDIRVDRDRPFKEIPTGKG